MAEQTPPVDADHCKHCGLLICSWSPCCEAWESEQNKARLVPDADREFTAGLFRALAAGRREYTRGLNSDDWRHAEIRSAFLAEATTWELAARIAAGDYGPLYDLLPSWRWTDAMHQRVLSSTSGGTTTADVAALAVPDGQTALPTERDTLVTPTVYEVTCLPAAADPDYDLWTIRVERRGHGRWSVQHLTKSLGVDDSWSFGPRDGEDATAWVDAHRFDLDTALRLAREHAPRVTVNGLTAADVLARHTKETRP